MEVPVLNIIGTGRLGRVLGRLLADHNLVRIGTLYSRNLNRAEEACGFIRQGVPTNQLDSCGQAELWLLAVADDAIATVSMQLSRLKLNWAGTTVFHCSGIHPASVLESLQTRGAETASLHPAHSFADPVASLASFSGVYCTLEGTSPATELLEQLFTPLGARLLPLDPRYKPLYHAATAVASNHLVALIDSAVTLLTAAGIDESVARPLLKPLVMNSCANVLNLGGAQALTGPVARGDSGTVGKHLEAIKNHQPALLNSYLALAELALALAASWQSAAAQTQIASLLQQYPPIRRG